MHTGSIRSRKISKFKQDFATKGKELREAGLPDVHLGNFTNKIRSVPRKKIFVGYCKESGW